MQFHIIMYASSEITKRKNLYNPLYTSKIQQFDLWKFIRYFTKSHSMY